MVPEALSRFRAERRNRTRTRGDEMIYTRTLRATGFVAMLALLSTVGVEYLSFSAADGLLERSGWSLRPQLGLKLRY
jgi:hypothetical protein